MMQRCQYCSREMRTSVEVYRENSFCRRCLNERIAIAAAAQGPTELRFVGDYAIVVAKEAG